MLPVSLYGPSWLIAFLPRLMFDGGEMASQRFTELHSSLSLALRDPRGPWASTLCGWVNGCLLYQSTQMYSFIHSGGVRLCIECVRMNNLSSCSYTLSFSVWHSQGRALMSAHASALIVVRSEMFWRNHNNFLCNYIVSLFAFLLSIWARQFNCVQLDIKRHLMEISYAISLMRYL